MRTLHLFFKRTDHSLTLLYPFQLSTLTIASPSTDPEGPEEAPRAPPGGEPAIKQPSVKFQLRNFLHLCFTIVTQQEIHSTWLPTCQNLLQKQFLF